MPASRKSLRPTDKVSAQFLAAFATGLLIYGARFLFDLPEPPAELRLQFETLIAAAIVAVPHLAGLAVAWWTPEKHPAGRGGRDADQS